ncbi:DUF6676 family protein [Corynebacterium sp. Q4381]|uniref:Rv1476 family membrane protein n=1 Tax=Corynebacterium sp. Marseille-Q4381 TaxID=3121597 RepID=UPI002FE65058
MTDIYANFATLADQLRASGAAFGREEEGSAQVREAMGQVLDSATGIVLLDHTPEHVPQLRDLAQDLANETGLDTVIVRTPHVAIGVSDTLSRAEVEEGQRAMAAQQDPVAGLADFYAASSAFSVPWGAFAVAVTVAVALIIAATVAATRRSSH